MKKGTFLAALICSVAGIGWPLLAKPTIQVNPIHANPDAATVLTVEQALSQADVPTLVRLYQTSTDPVSRVLAAMALERIHFSLEKASEDARLCEQSLIDSKPEIAFFCAKLANGNLRLAQGARQADAAELDIARRFAGKLPQSQLDQLRSYVEGHLQGSPLQVNLPSQSFSIPLHHSLANGNVPDVEAESHGKRTWLLVDTGSSTLTLDEDAARALGVTMLERTGKARGVLSRNIPTRYGTLDRLTIGEVTLLNVPVTVISGRHRLIGIDILRRLGTFRLGENAITVGASDHGGSACNEPMLIASNVWGTELREVAALRIDGQLRTTLLDTGTSSFLVADQHALDELHSNPGRRMNVRDMGSHLHATRVSRATADVDIAGQPFTVTFDILKDASLPWHYVLGSGALRQMDFYFNFNAHHTCLLLHRDQR